MISQQEQKLQTSTSLSPSLPCLKTIHHSSHIIAVSNIKLYHNNQQTQYLLFAKPSTLDFYYYKDSHPIFSHSINLYTRITSLLVIPTRHKVSDSIFITDVDHVFTIYRPDENNQLERLIRKTFGLGFWAQEGEQIKEKMHHGLECYYNANDTEGYIYWCRDTQLHILRFAEKIYGFHEISLKVHQVPSNLLFIVGIPRSKSRYKEHTIAICHIASKQAHLSIYDTQLNECASNLAKIQLSPNTTTAHAGYEFITVDPFNIKLYSYDLGEIIQTYKQPQTGSIKKIINLTNTYCGIGDHLIIFNKTGTTFYGTLGAENGKHIGNNKVISWHQLNNTKMVELNDEYMEVVQEWVNLGPIEEINVVEIEGEDSYLVKSHEKKNPIALVTNAVGFHQIAKQEIEGSIKELLLLEDDNGTKEGEKKLNKGRHQGEIYLLMSFYNRQSLVFRVRGNNQNVRIFSKVNQNMLDEVEECAGLENILLTYKQYVVTTKGIFKFQKKSFVNYLTFQEQITKAAISSSGVLLLWSSTTKVLTYFHILNPSVKKQIKVDSFISAFTIHTSPTTHPLNQLQSSIVVYCCWGSRKVRIVLGNGQESKVKILREARSLYLNDDNMFVGYSQGKIQVYSIGEKYSKVGEFGCGTTPVQKIFQIENKIYCLSNKSCEISSYAPNCFTKKNILLNNLTSFLNLSLSASISQPLIATSTSNTLSLHTPDLSTNIQIQQLPINLQSSYHIPKMVSFSPYIYLFQPFRIHRYDIADPKFPTQFHHDLSEITCNKIEVWQEDYLLIAGKLPIDHTIMLMRREMQEARLRLSSVPLCLKGIERGFVVIGSENNVKFVRIKEEVGEMGDSKKWGFEERFTKYVDVIPYGIDVLVEEKKIVIGDTVRELLLCSYDLEKETFHVLSKFSLGNLSLDVAFLGNYILESDNFSNLFLVSGNLGAPNQLEKTVLSFNGGLQINESIWVMSKSSTKSENSSLNQNKKQEIIYGTSEGSIGKIVLLPNHSSTKLRDFFTRIQQAANEQNKSIQDKSQTNILSIVLNKGHEKLRSFKKNKFNMKNNSLLNGDLLEHIVKSKDVQKLWKAIKNDEEKEKQVEKEGDVELNQIRRLIDSLDI